MQWNLFLTICSACLALVIIIIIIIVNPTKLTKLTLKATGENWWSNMSYPNKDFEKTVQLAPHTTRKMHIS